MVLQSEGIGTIAGPPARGVSGVAAAIAERVVRRMVVRDILVDLSGVVPFGCCGVDTRLEVGGVFCVRYLISLVDVLM